MTAQNLISHYNKNSKGLKTVKEIRTFLVEFRSLAHGSLLLESNKNDIKAIEKLIDTTNKILQKTY